MLTKGAVNVINTQSPSIPFYPVLQIISIKTKKSGYILRLSDSLNSIKCYFPGHQMVPVLFSAILLEEYEIITPLLILIKYTQVQVYTILLGKPEKVQVSSSFKCSGFTLIRSLSVNLATWLLKLRLVYKSAVKDCKKSANYFYCIFIDENNDDILVYFNQETFDTYFSSLTLRKMYLISRGRIRKNDRGEHKGKFLIYIDKSSKVVEIHDDHSIKHEKFTFKDIKSIYKLNLPSRIDTFGIIKSITNSGISSIEIQDKSNSTIQLFCSQPLKPIPRFSVIVCKNVQYEPNSCVLISDSTSSLLINPKGFSEVDSLKELSVSYWKSLSYCYTIAEIKDLISIECFPDEINFFGFVSEVIIDDLHPFWYPACCNLDKCSKKVESHSFGFYYCKECKAKFENFCYKFAVEVVISDLTGSIKVKIFDSVGRGFFGCSAEELALCYLQDRDNAEEILFNVIGKQMNFTIIGRQIGKSIPISKISPILPQSLTKILLSELSEAIK